jgi:hypothetical protein
LDYNLQGTKSTSKGAAGAVAFPILKGWNILLYPKICGKYSLYLQVYSPNISTPQNSCDLAGIYCKYLHII